ncbi:MAG TPA: septation protein SepH, partial [Streptosporangiaceae bacterium]|nr:septation protein SepH [Streptosporangiaceae bacterium]
MQELRLVAVSEDGSYAVLAVPGRGGRFSLPIDDRLRTVARGQFSRLAQYEIEVESPLRPKEIQDRIRAGETADEIADAAGVPIERVRRFEGPVLAERAYRAQEAQRATIRQPGDSGPGPRLGDIVAERLVTFGSTPEDALWDSRKRADGNWEVQLMFTAGGRPHMAEWVFDPRRRHVTPADDDAARLSLPEADLPPPLRAPSAAPRATVTPIATRLAPLGPPTVVAGPGSHAQPEPEQERRHAHAAAQAAAGSMEAPPRSASREAQARADGREAQARPGSREAQARPGSREAQARASSRDMPQQGSVGRETAIEEDSAAQSPPPARERPVRKAAGGRSRRSSVPSWDEIMFGNSRQPD